MLNAKVLIRNAWQMCFILAVKIGLDGMTRYGLQHFPRALQNISGTIKVFSDCFIHWCGWLCNCCRADWHICQMACISQFGWHRCKKEAQAVEHRIFQRSSHEEMKECSVEEGTNTELEEASRNTNPQTSKGYRDHLSQEFWTVMAMFRKVLISKQLAYIGVFATLISVFQVLRWDCVPSHDKLCPVLPTPISQPAQGILLAMHPRLASKTAAEQYAESWFHALGPFRHIASYLETVPLVGNKAKEFARATDVPPTIAAYNWLKGSRWPRLVLAVYHGIEDPIHRSYDRLYVSVLRKQLFSTLQTFDEMGLAVGGALFEL